MNKNKAIADYNKFNEETNALSYALTLINFDNETGAPIAASKQRNKVMSYFQNEIFKRETSDEYKTILNNLNKYYDKLPSTYKRIVDLENKAINKNSKVPFKVMEHFNEAYNNAYYAWIKAKKENNYNLFKDALKEVISSQLEVGNYQKEANISLYENFLEDYEEGINEATLDNFFKTLKETIVPLVAKIKEANVDIKDDFLYIKIPKDKQLKMGLLAVKAIGYNPSKGLIRETEHPFTDKISTNDVRITTHIYEKNFTSNLFSLIHEGGHGIYEQNLNNKYEGTILKEAISMAFHESQSRLFENIIGRSYAFNYYFYPKIQKLANHKLDNVSLDEYYLAINKVTPSLIRTEADELTYCLHILIRYEIEKKMARNEINYDELPAIWNKKYQEYLGVNVPSDAEGVLQDIHWTGGIGYFFSYALGNAYSAQIYQAMQKEIDVDNLLKNGKCKEIVKWLKEHVYQYGSYLPPKELIKKATNEEFNPSYYCNYLKEKYTKIYHLK